MFRQSFTPLSLRDPLNHFRNLQILRHLKAASTRRGAAYVACNRWFSQGQDGNKKVRIGCASGFWGDTAVSAPQLIHGGNIDYLVFDYLSEITMSLLTAAKQKNQSMGYAPDFVEVAIGRYLKDIKNKGIRVVSNAGGVNPTGCAEALAAAANKAGVDLKIATVLGDDLAPQLPELQKLDLKEMDSGKPFPKGVHSMNAYLGAAPIAKALDHGADIVVTGRCVDSALALGPLMHEFKWRPDDFDLLASGSLAGHLIECGAQATGGVFTDWHLVNDWHFIGFPIVECEADGSFIVTKPEHTGGMVTKATVAEQLVYEIGDPRRYLLPDVACDFSNVSMEDLGGDRVRVTGAKGTPPSSDYKVSATHFAGFKCTVACCVGGPRAAEKGVKTAEAIINRVNWICKSLDMGPLMKTHIQVVGTESTYGAHANQKLQPREVMLWISVAHKNKEALNIFSREIAPAGTGMAPGLMGIVGQARPRPTPVLRLFSFLYPKDELKVDININGECVDSYTAPPLPPPTPVDDTPAVADAIAFSGDHSYRLEELAYTRSGDKGNHCNIGVIARHPKFLPYLRQALTAQAVSEYFKHVFEEGATNTEERVKRYDLPGIHGLNFMLFNSLGGGGVASHRTDPQGKAYGQMLLDFEVTNVPSIKEMIGE